MSTRDAITLVGTGIGLYFGNPQLGYMIGSAVGSAVDPEQIEGPRVGNISTPSTEYGWWIPRPYGREIYEGSVVWLGPVVEVGTTTEGKGGPEVTEYSARQDAQVLFSEAGVVAVLRLWINKKLVYSTVGDAESSAASLQSTSFDSIEILLGDEDQLPWSVHEAAVGVGKCPAYIGRCTLGLKGVALEGGTFPMIEAELATVSARTHGSYVNWRLDSTGGNWAAEPGSSVYTEPGRVLIKTGNTFAMSAYNGTEYFATIEGARSAGIATAEGGVTGPGEVFLSIVSASPTSAGASGETWTVACLVYVTATASQEVQYYSFSIAWSAGFFRFTAFGVASYEESKLGAPRPDLGNQGLVASGSGDVRTVGIISSTATQKFRLFSHTGEAYLVSGGNGRGSYAVLGTNTYIATDGTGPVRRFVDGSGMDGASQTAASYTNARLAASATALYVLAGGTVYVLDPTALTVSSSFTAGVAEWLMVDSTGELYCYGNQRVYHREGAAWVEVLNVTGSAFDTNAMLHTPGYEAGILYATQTATQAVGYEKGFVGLMSVPLEDPAAIEVNDVLLPELLRAGIPASAINLAATAGIPLVGYKASGPAKDACQTLATGHNFDWRHGAQLATFLLTAAPVRTIPFRDMGFGVEQPMDDPIALERDGSEEVPRRFALTVRNADQDFANLTVQFDRRTGTNAEISNVALPIAMHADRAQALVDSMGRRAALTSMRTTLGLDDRHAELEEGDIVTAPDALGNAYTLRLVRGVAQQGVRSFEAVVEDVAAFTSTSTATDTSYTPSVSVNPPGGAELILVDAPILRDADDQLGAYAAVDIAGASSATLYMSLDDAVYNPAGHTNFNATAGRIDSPPGIASPDVWDMEHTFVVRLTGGTLASATRAAMDADPTLNILAIGGAGRWQYVRFLNAVLTSPGTYTVSGLLQGWAGTEHNIGRQFSGDEVVLMRSGIITAAITTTEVGLERWWKAAPAGRRLSSVTPDHVAITGERKRPRSVTCVRLTMSGGDTIATWVRRTRMAVRYSGGRSVPLGEASEQYEVVFYADAGFGLATHSVVVNVPSITIAAADRAAWGDWIRIHQLSAVVGRGQPVSIALP